MGRPRSNAPLLVPAVYRKTEIRGLEGNPLVEALPRFPQNVEDSFLALSRPIFFDPDERSDSDFARISATDRLEALLEPQVSHHNLFQNVYSHIIHGYRRRPIQDKAFRRSVVASYRNAVLNNMQEIAPPSFPLSTAMTFYGISGVGKSCLIERILSLLPQAITHPKHGIIQVVSVKVDCPANGSLLSLFHDAVDQVDSVVGSHWGQGFKRLQSNDLLLAANSVFQTHCLGVLVIDEIQNLLRSRDGPEKVLQFFVNVANRVKVPLILIGTPAALPLFRRCFAQARRAGPQEILPIQKGEQWELFVSQLWRYQWVKVPQPLTPEITNCVFDETFGIPGLAIQLFRLAQRVAIQSGSEVVSEREIRTTADRYMKAVRPALRALKSGAENPLHEFNDLIDRTISDCRNN